MFESDIALRKLLFLGRLITDPKMAKSVRSLFMSRAESCFDASVTSMAVLPSITEEALNKYDLFHFFVSWFRNSTFPTFSNWKWIVKTKLRNFEYNAWADYCVNHLSMHMALACLKNVTSYQFCCVADNYQATCTFSSDLWVILDSTVVYHGMLALNGSHCVIYKQGVQGM